MRLGPRSISGLWLLAISSAPLAAQNITGSISGTVADRSGSVIVGVSVMVTSETTAAARATTTDSSGNFQFNAIQSGKYRLTVEHAGFKKYEKAGIELGPNQSLSIGAINLVLGDVSQSVTVNAEIAVVQTTSGERSGIITSEEVENLTIMSRDFSGLVTLLPGVVDDPGAQTEMQGRSGIAPFYVGGNRNTSNSVTIDGGSVESSGGQSASTNNYVSMDSVQAVRIVTSNYTAEFGRKPGAGIMAVTKGGTRSFHGAVYEFYRHEWINANQFFNNRNGVAQTPRRVHTPGFTIGGPAYIPGLFNTGKSKLFFFTSLEFIRERRPQSIRNLTVPTDLELQGDFSRSLNSSGRLPVVNDPMDAKRPFPGNVIPAARINPNGQNYLRLLPRPNDLNDPIARFQYNFQTQESLNIPKHSTNDRVDYIIDSNTTAYLKFNYWWEDQQGWAVSAGNANWGWLPTHYTTYTYAPVLSITRIVSPRLILEAAGRVTRWVEGGPILNASDYDRLNRKKSGVNIPQFWPGLNPHDLVPAATFGGIIANPPNTSYATRFPLMGAETPVFSDASLTYTHGAHVTKSGLYLERWTAMKGEWANWSGTLDFTQDANNSNDANHPFANTLLGNFKSYTESNTRPAMYEGTTSVEWFLQDNWRVTRKLTVDLGARFGWSQPWHSLRRGEAAFVPGLWNPSKAVRLMTPVRVNNVRYAQDPSSGQLYPMTVIGAIATSTGDPYNGTVNLLTNTSYPHGLRYNSGLKVAPRFGFAYDPWGNGKTAIRGGFGLFYEIHERLLSTYPEMNPPNQLSPQIFYGDLKTFINTSGVLFPSNTGGMNANRPLARTMSYSFGIQRQAGWGFLVDAAYVGTLGRHLPVRQNLNSIAAGTTQQAWAQDPSNPGSALAAQYLRPYVGYGDIIYSDYTSNSSYHSLQLMVNRRFMKNVSGGLAYTWSRAMDYADDETVALSALASPKVKNYGWAGYDRPHVLKGNWVWAMPKGSRLLPNRSGLSQAGKGLLDGWQISGIVTLMSGAPQAAVLSLTSGTNFNWSGSPTDAARPDLIGDATLPKSERTFYRYFNTAAFGLPAQGTLGNEAKYVFRGPGRNNFDISLFKNFRMTERLRAQFRAESYNTFNHTQFSSLNLNAQFNVKTGALTSPSFGNLTGANLARRMQLALRITF